MNTLDWNEVCRLAKNGNPAPDRRIEKTDSQWQEQLSPEAFRVTRQHGTEAPGSNSCQHFEAGLYACVCCAEPLFDATQKFESGSGWPSFRVPLKNNVVQYTNDESHGMIRIEAGCAVCDAHLGHVFPDGPSPSGLRFCMNGAALTQIQHEN